MKKLNLTTKMVKVAEFTANAEQHASLAEKHNFNAFVLLTKSAEHIENLKFLTAK